MFYGRSSTDIIGYTWDADTWCEDCLREALAKDGHDSEEINLILERGDDIGVVFVDNEEQWDEGMSCNACHEELISNPHNVKMGEQVVRVDYRRVSKYDRTPIEPCFSGYTVYRVQFDQEVKFVVHTEYPSSQIDQERILQVLREMVAVANEYQSFAEYAKDTYDWMRDGNSLSQHRVFYLACVAAKEDALTFLGQEDFDDFFWE